MIALAALLLVQAAADKPATNADALPVEWSKLPDLPLIQRRGGPSPELSRFVRDEVAAGRCAAAQHDAGGFALSVELAVLVSGSGEARRIVPRAIGCPTVEQYSVGIVSRMTRANLPQAASCLWYHVTLDFTWKE